jgi:hypothetical protein
VLIDNDASSDVDGMRGLLASVNRNTWREKFSSSFRTRKQPLDAAVAAGVVRAWDRAIGRRTERAEAYWEALPYWDAGVVDRDRHGTHQKLLKAARGEDRRFEEDEDDDRDDVTAASVPPGASCRPRAARTEPKAAPRPPRRC